MNKKQRLLYEKQIDEMSDKTVLKVYGAALDYSQQIYKDMLVSLRRKIDEEIQRIESNEQDNHQAV
jgi:hypothetical protein